MKKILFTLALSVLAFPAFAHEGVHVKDAYAFATAPSQKTGAVFLTIENAGPADKVVSVSTDVSERAELHTVVGDETTSAMKKIDSVDVPEKTNVDLKVNGPHIMLMNLKAPLKLGDMFKLTVTFEKAGAVETDVMVTPPGVTNPGEHHH